MRLDASTVCVVLALVVVLNSLYAQHRANKLFMGTLERCITSLEHLHEDGKWVRTNKTSADDGDDRLLEALRAIEKTLTAMERILRGIRAGVT